MSGADGEIPTEAWRLPRSAEEEAEEAWFLRWYGRWEPLDPDGVRALLEGFDRPWWLIGGWAIEAFTGRRRVHEDMDISLLACDVPALRAHLGDAWTIWSNLGGTLRPLDDRHPEPIAPDGQLWVRRSAAEPWVLDIPTTPDDHGRWTNKRLPSHTATVEEVTWLTPDGLRCQRPEIVLLFKGAQDRPAAGHADILLFPDIQAGNLVYKTLVHTADCKNGCILTGTKVPAILTSRSDSFQTKVNSIALAAVVAAGLDQ